MLIEVRDAVVKELMDAYMEGVKFGRARAFAEVERNRRYKMIADDVVPVVGDSHKDDGE